MIQPAGYNDSIFVNCPFDAEYSPIFRAIIFVIYRCGFWPKSALEEDNALDYRLDKIIRIIEGCRFGVHDISRTELNSNSLPRFNMPFELGIFFGAKRFGDKYQKTKIALVFERHKYLYQEYISDINGIDTKAHDNDPYLVIGNIRDWLRTASKRRNFPGTIKIVEEYIEFQAKLPAIADKLGLDIGNMLFDDFCLIVEDAMARKYLKNNQG